MQKSVGVRWRGLPIVGKKKKKKAIVKGFSTDKNNQPQVVTDKGTYSLYRFRLKKLMPKRDE